MGEGRARAGSEVSSSRRKSGLRGQRRRKRSRSLHHRRPTGVEAYAYGGALGVGFVGEAVVAEALELVAGGEAHVIADKVLHLPDAVSNTPCANRRDPLPTRGVGKQHPDGNPGPIERRKSATQILFLRAARTPPWS